MAKKVISLNLDEETIKDIDELSEKIGISRSAFCEMTLRTAVGSNSLTGFYKAMFASLVGKEDEEKGDFVTAQ